MQSNVMSASFSHHSEVELIKRAAKSMGMTPSGFIRMAALETAGAIAASWDVGRMKKRTKERKAAHLRLVKK